jgi:16S rRNA (uracil1498-N3)-methyltransferase
VAAIEPLITEHTARHPGRTQDRWKKITIASAKQCGRAFVPPVGAGTRFTDWLPADNSEMRLILIEPSANLAGHTLSTLAGASPASASLLVGPEGGWSPDEIDAAVGAGYLPITLGHRTLRADAVPIVAIGVLQFVWGDL